MVYRPVTEPLEAGIARQRGVFEALSLLTPSDLPDERKIRIGGPGDGGYVLVDRLRPAQPVMSFGVGPSVAFDQDLAARGHPVLLFDQTIDALPGEHPGFTWYRRRRRGHRQSAAAPVHPRGPYGEAAPGCGGAHSEDGCRGGGMGCVDRDPDGAAASFRADRAGAARIAAAGGDSVSQHGLEGFGNAFFGVHALPCACE